ncbi:receptor-interacting serine/threonine-protein kinase 4 [Spatholobus suberectus]|nr:receptor-interacting serine/threonine-protein kinase 4 [Spatholobus suberectus]
MIANSRGELYIDRYANIIMSAASMNGIVVEVLNRENYWTWSALVKNYLEGNDLWYDIIVPSSEDQKPNEEDPEWKRRNSRALHAVQLSCGNDALFQIRNSTKAKEAWGQLKTSYDKEDETHHESHQSPPVLYEQAHHESHQSRPVLYEQIIMSAPSMNGIVVEVLNRENYPNWRTLVKNYLMGNGLWYKIIYDDDEDEKNDDEGKKEQRKPRKENIEKDPELQSKNRRALHAIQLSCGKALGQIRKCIAAREAWDQLKISFSEDVKARRNVEQTRSDDDKTLQIFVRKGFLDDAKLGIDVFPDDIFLRSPDGRTVLHTAVAVGHVELVNKLVKIGNQRLLKMQDKKGYTALALAAKLTDNKEMAESMVKNGGEELLTIKSKALEHQGVDEIPVLLASLKGHKKMTRYLFTKTPWSALSQNSWEYGLMLLSRCISNEIFDVAAAILRHPDALQLPLYHPKKGLQPIYQLAHMPSAFFSTGTKLNWWKQFIYNILRVKDLKNEIIKIVFLEPDEMERPNIMTHTLPGRLLGQFQQFIQTLIVSKFAVFQKIHEKKMDHYLVLEILNCLCKRLPKMISEELHEASAYDAMLQAAKNGITEFIKSMKDANPDLLLAMDESKRGIFAHAIVNRQEEMFQLIHDIRSKEIITSVEDALGNNLMHIAAEIGPSRYLDGISNAALQMQRELQWFHVIKSNPYIILES